MPRPLAEPARLVYELRGVLRARLLLGFCHRLSAPCSRQYVVKIYCLLVAVLITLVTYITEFANAPFIFWFWYGRIRCLQYLINVFTSLYTEESFMFTFCTRVDLTDVTIDSASIFFKFEKRYKRIIIFLVSCTLLIRFINLFFWLETFLCIEMLGLIFEAVLETAMSLNFMSKLVVLAVLSGRLRVLRARLARHGFRRASDCALGRNVYCDMYDRIMQDFDKIQPQLKFLLTVDIIADTVCCICMLCVAFGNWNAVAHGLSFLGVIKMAAPLYLLCSEAESAAAQVDAIREFAVTELIKHPCERERRAILELLELTVAMPARVTLCRALRVDARLALAALGFCTGRVVLILQITR